MNINELRILAGIPPILEAKKVEPAKEVSTPEDDVTDKHVDNKEEKDKRAGKDVTAELVSVDKTVISSINARIKELDELEDEKSSGAKSNAIDSLKKIKEYIEQGTVESHKYAQIFFGTLMSPITDLIPAKVVNYIAKWHESK